MVVARVLQCVLKHQTMEMQDLPCSGVSAGIKFAKAC